MSFTRQQRHAKSNALFRSQMTNHGAELPARVLVECDGCRKQVEKVTPAGDPVIKFLCDDCKKSTNEAHAKP